MTAIERFRREFRRWVQAHNRAKGYTTDPGGFPSTLQGHIGETRLARIGSAYLNGWLETETEPGRGYFVRDSDRPGRRGGQFTITHQGEGKVAPCWELFVQLADYAWLRTVAERHGQEVRFEDRLMDLTVRAGGRLVLYVEQKTTRHLAKKLVDRMRRYGDEGFTLEDPDRGNDALRKAKYLVRDESHPIYFGLSAVNYRQLFKVEYLDGNRFRLIDDARSFTAPLVEYRASADGQPSPWSPVDPLAMEMEGLCPEIWISVGSEQTAYNFYCPTEGGGRDHRRRLRERRGLDRRRRSGPWASHAPGRGTCQRRDSAGCDQGVGLLAAGAGEAEARGCGSGARRGRRAESHRLMIRRSAMSSVLKRRVIAQGYRRSGRTFEQPP